MSRVANARHMGLDVYFDDVVVTVTPSMVVGVNEYYPFGLTFNSYSRENGLSQDYKYNGKESQDATGSWDDQTAPRAYLNYILFDQNFVQVDMGWQQVSTAAKQNIPSSSAPTSSELWKDFYGFPSSNS